LIEARDDKNIPQFEIGLGLKKPTATKDRKVED